MPIVHLCQLAITWPPVEFSYQYSPLPMISGISKSFYKPGHSQWAHARAHHFQGTHWVAMFQKILNFKGCFLVRFEAGRIQLFILILTQLHLYKHCSDNIDIVQSSCSLNCMFALSLSEQNSNLKISWFAVTRENQQSYICLICLKLHLCNFLEVLNTFIYHCLKWLLHACQLLHDSGNCV